MGRARALFGRCLLAGAAAIVVAGCVASSAAAAVPHVTPLEASAVTASSAKINVGIDPEGGETSWEIALECRGSNSCEEAVSTPQRAVGVLVASTGQEVVSDEVSGLQPDSYYRYTVIATNSSGREGWVGVNFRTCPSTGPCPSQGVPGGEQLWNFEGARREAEEAPRLEAEREKAKREGEERAAREAAALTARELAIRQAGERAGREAAERELAARAQRCVVPHLVGRSLAGARRALSAAHCTLGRVSAPRGDHGPLVVSHQGARAGQKLAKGSRVAVTLAAKRA